MSKAEMSKILDISLDTFNKKLRGSSDFTVAEIFKMQEVFNDSGCTFEYLLRT